MRTIFLSLIFFVSAVHAETILTCTGQTKAGNKLAYTSKMDFTGYMGSRNDYSFTIDGLEAQNSYPNSFPKQLVSEKWNEKTMTAYDIMVMAELLNDGLEKIVRVSFAGKGSNLNQLGVTSIIKTGSGLTAKDYDAVTATIDCQMKSLEVND